MYTGLLYGMGALFGLVTTLVAIFKKEKDYSSEDDNLRLNIFQTYTLMWHILKLSSVRLLVTVLLTMKVNIIKFNFQLHYGRTHRYIRLSFLKFQMHKIFFWIKVVIFSMLL